MIPLISAVIAAVVAYFTARHASYTDVTTKSRIDWIKTVRELSIAYINALENNNANKAACLLHKLEIYLNPLSDADKDVLKSANNGSVSEFKPKIQAYLKAEWERVKYESNGKKYDDIQFNEKYIELLSKIEDCDMNNSSHKVKTFKRFLFSLREILGILISVLKIFLLITVIVLIIMFIIALFTKNDFYNNLTEIIKAL